MEMEEEVICKIEEGEEMKDPKYLELIGMTVS